MGESQWRARELPPSRVAVMRRRSVETWDLISTPTPEMTAVYREQYGYDRAGRRARLSPQRRAARPGRRRGCAARDPAPARHRARTRRPCSTPPRGVTISPSRPRAAAMTEHLDVDAAAASLGDSHVILLRGHRFHAPGPVAARGRRRDRPSRDQRPRPGLRRRGARLLLAAVRLRADRRPMVFLVPDLEDYTGGVRGFLFPFTDTAPGPLVRTTDEVVAQVRDVPSARRDLGRPRPDVRRAVQPVAGRPGGVPLRRRPGARARGDVRLTPDRGDAWPIRTIR